MEKNSFLQLLEREFSNLTPTGKRIASYLLGNPEQLPFESADSIAQQTSTTGISVGRFFDPLATRTSMKSNRACALKRRRRGLSPIASAPFVPKAISKMLLIVP
nr:hypothetical protein GCM10020185_75640 [Pseudomonas brassicacearum subsp. brassicacearum]